jgi:glycosyltransferase involved in cell wall biosynthesis
VTTQVLALNSYHGGSHRAFLEGWKRHSRHQITALSLPPYKWKWRMRHAAITFAEQVSELVRNGHEWDVLFCTDMLNLAEFLGLSPPHICRLPRVVYFHENQLTYPRRHEDQRDLHFAFTNMTTALAGDRVWFNSAFHRETFLDALSGLLKRMPDYQPTAAVASIRKKSEIRFPGVEPSPPRTIRAPGHMRILWAARWEHDKDPDCFFRSLYRLQEQGCHFRLSVLGESFGDVPACFDEARRRLADRIDHWGYLPDREDYRQALRAADVVVSTARHEFFGIATVEAAVAGCYPVLPNRLAYPEVFGCEPGCLYDGTEAGLVQRLLELSPRAIRGTLACDAQRLTAALARFLWPDVAEELDAAVDRLRGEERMISAE